MLVFLIATEKMNDFFELIRRQASYAELAAWMQKQEQCSYLKACLKVNEELKRYRLRSH